MSHTGKSHVGPFACTSRDGNIKRAMYSTHCSTLQHAATHYNTLQHTATHCNTHRVMVILKKICIRHTAAHCNTLQLIATHCNSLQLTATHCDTLQHTSRDGNIKRDMYSTHCSTLQLTATHYNTLQHTATHCNTHRVMVISKETCIPFTHSLHTTTLLLIYLTFQPYIHCKEPSIHSQKLPTRVP